ncbi:hypothetical protein BJ875DRAFT_137433 [Amylocarpus encephaloides]|uniref:BHLH domain-containing protein n=1 Tax=Amylocarpus encephaloides TaxID=45428 RepID=A0A9P8C897_9HELO|nr:hypothetical protein BJ875DRAFT_137433 [Amylocarpus encephaloides]
MMDSSSVWHNQDPTLSGPSQDDFNQFLDLGMNSLSDSLQFDFQDFGAQHPGQTAQLMHPHDHGAMDHSGLENGRGNGTTMQEHMPTITTVASHPAILGSTLHHAQSSSESLVELDAQIQYLQQQKHQRQQQMQHRHIQQQQENFFAHNGMIPPTPNSMELHASTSQFYPQSDPQQQAIFERFQMQVKDQDMAFTPLVSPAVTPLETNFNIPEYTIPSAYFSPLSSPALRAQNERQAALYDTRFAAAEKSPVDMSVDSHSASTSSGALSRKTSKKATPKPRSTRAVRQSPIVKPKRSKKGSLVAQALGDIIEPSHISAPLPKDQTTSLSGVSTEESENGSISPEHLSEMAPPPVPTPGSSTRSPYIPAQKEDPRNQRLILGSPATPASLMRLTQSPQINEPDGTQSMDVDDPEMDAFSLPEAANISKPQLTRLDTQSDGQMTPTLSSTGAKTPGFQPLPSPAFARPSSTVSANSSPQIDAMNGSTNGRKSNQAGARSKKRSSSSVLASPALLPRISPSIKPLISGSGKVSDNTASLLLTSKSNYQNILEGNHLPGVSYPSELSTNLTSKRTSHKIAEQGRRNRINSALQEIATLLPRGTGKDSCEEKSGDAGDGNDAANAKGGAQSANSKASTVEQAIDYIKQLRADLADANKRAEEAEKLLATTS